MKGHMTSYIGTHRTQMFTQSVDGVKARLTTMCREVEEEMANKADEVWSAMNRDYTQVVSGTRLPEGQQMPKWERVLKANVARIITEHDNGVGTNEIATEGNMSTLNRVCSEEVVGKAEVIPPCDVAIDTS